MTYGSLYTVLESMSNHVLQFQPKRRQDVKLQFKKRTGKKAIAVARFKDASIDERKFAVDNDTVIKHAGREKNREYICGIYPGRCVVGGGYVGETTKSGWMNANDGWTVDVCGAAFVDRQSGCLSVCLSSVHASMWLQLQVRASSLRSVGSSCRSIAAINHRVKTPTGRRRRRRRPFGSPSLLRLLPSRHASLLASAGTRRGNCAVDRRTSRREVSVRNGSGVHCSDRLHCRLFSRPSPRPGRAFSPADKFAESRIRIQFPDRCSITTEERGCSGKYGALCKWRKFLERQHFRLIIMVIKIIIINRFSAIRS